MTDTQYKTRGGNAAFLLGHGPISKTFLQFEVENRRYLVWEKTLRYRMDDDDQGKPVLSDLDILKIE